jgi:hypothetical protein
VMRTAGVILAGVVASLSAAQPQSNGVGRAAEWAQGRTDAVGRCVTYPFVAPGNERLACAAHDRVEVEARVGFWLHTTASPCGAPGSRFFKLGTGGL